MPWDVVRGGGTCRADQWAVVRRGGKTVGCHDSEQSAKRQLAALNVNVRESGVPKITTTAASPVETLIEQARETGLLDEAKYSAQQLRDLLAKGHAIKNDAGDPSYPIDDEEDLGRAIRAVGRGGAGHNRIRKYIAGRARAMGKSDAVPDSWGKSGGLKESALAETTPLAEAVRGTPTGRRMQIQIASPGWGSSGYYSETVLKQAAADAVFGKDLPLYVDHQTISESQDRIHGERSVKDLAARFVEDARWDGTGLVAEVEVTNPAWRPVLAEMRDHVGVSMRAIGQAEMGEAEGREGLLVQSIDRALSVDFVAEAGRGGKVLALLESTRTELAEARNVGGWLEARLHTAFTELTDGMYGDGRLTREERISLSSGIGDALAAFTARVEADAPQLYERDPWADPAPVAAAMEETSKGGAPPTNIPKEASVSGSSTGAPPEGGGSTTTTQQPVEVTEAAARVEQLEKDLTEARAALETRSNHQVRAAEAERQLTESRGELARLRAAEVARTQTAAALAESGLPEPAFARVTAAVVGHEGRGVPLTESATVDADKLKAAIKAAVDAERTYIASVAESLGMGAVRGLGGDGKGAELTEAKFEEGMAALYEVIGMDEKTAKMAARGRA
jgi:hypothetical protein